MTLSGHSPSYLHFAQNALLILIALAFIPLCTCIALLSRIVAPWTQTARHIRHHRQWRALSSSTFRPRTVLVTGVGMNKGLSIARAFYRAGHRVIGADFEPYGIPVSGHFSAALDRFYPLKPIVERPVDSERYVEDLINIVKSEKVELWVSCSGVASAIEDAEAAETIEKHTKCKAFQFGVSMTETLHEKHTFIQHTAKLGLNVPDTRLVDSTQQVLRILHPKDPSPGSEGKQYILKPVGMDDSSRADLGVLLPRPTRQETKAHVSRLQPSPFRPFVLQQYIKGPEYCTHSIVLRGRVLLFVACASSDMLMHYRALPPTSALSQAMLAYTTTYCEKTGSSMTGHFSLDFLVSQDDMSHAELAGTGDNEELVEGLGKKLFPIECNPRAHTAVTLFDNDKETVEAMAEAYLSLLPDHTIEPTLPSHSSPSPKSIITPPPHLRTNKGTYWIGHDVVALVLLPLMWYAFSFHPRARWSRESPTCPKELRNPSIRKVVAPWIEFVKHVLFWKDGVYETWDPWPWWWMYVGYWPLMLLVSIKRARWWSRVNVSTNKMFMVG